MELNVKEIVGVWDKGFSLDKHTIRSIRTGYNEYGHPEFKTLRTDIGEALFQLKYRSDFSQCAVIAQSINDHIIPLLPLISFIIAMPPSKIRQKQPVVEIAEALSHLTDKPCINDILLKSKNTLQMKDIPDRQVRIDTLLDAFELNSDAIAMKLPAASYNVLIIDDLFDTGTSLEAATRKLRECGKIGEIFVATATRKV
ncbi:ComF family protein [Photobacterium phosphoreum]|uniref:ComF family protein n=2 Tax=Photobacterium phosphoreum TaxID=659 RepID=UPI000D167DFB|nr:ComF family protein [Photobacterium phosphoreum]PSU59432.1 ComF family protein [Photobacterium phosphoreum]